MPTPPAPALLVQALPLLDARLRPHLGTVGAKADLVEALVILAEPYLLSLGFHDDPDTETIWLDAHTVRRNARVALDPATGRHWAPFLWVEGGERGDPAAAVEWLVGRASATGPLLVRAASGSEVAVHYEDWTAEQLTAAHDLATRAGLYTGGSWRPCHWAVTGRDPREVCIASPRVPDAALAEPAVAAWLAGAEMTRDVAARLAVLHEYGTAEDFLEQEATWRRHRPPVLGVTAVWEVEGHERWEPSWSVGLFTDPATAAAARAAHAAREEESSGYSVVRRALRVSPAHSGA